MRPSSDYTYADPALGNTALASPKASDASKLALASSKLAGQSALTKKTAKTGKSSKILNNLLNKLSSDKLLKIGLNRVQLEDVKAEINEQMRQNRTTHHNDIKLPKPSKFKLLTEDGSLTLTLVFVTLYNHTTVRLVLT